MKKFLSFIFVLLMVCVVGCFNKDKKEEEKMYIKYNDGLTPGSTYEISINDKDIEIKITSFSTTTDTDNDESVVKGKLTEEQYKQVKGILDNYSKKVNDETKDGYLYYLEVDGTELEEDFNFEFNTFVNSLGFILSEDSATKKVGSDELSNLYNNLK